jgi:hypothetical protein
MKMVNLSEKHRFDLPTKVKEQYFPSIVVPSGAVKKGSEAGETITFTAKCKIKRVEDSMDGGQTYTLEFREGSQVDDEEDK